MGAVGPGARVHDVELRAAARASQQCLAKVRTRQGIVTHRTMVAIGQRQVADPADQQRGARHQEPRHVTGLQLGQFGQRMPARTHLGQQGFGGMTAGPDGAESAVTTSIATISGAAARTASSTASSRVTADDGQLLQLPRKASRAVSPSIESSSTSPPCEPR